ncbi:MXAN_5187 C-terminal domain-containing protein [Sorangium sp. So ce1078]|uniref:MXAN_5187 C-terminal domain-containing protein n=1 Tax=Sorangium sp. So ce1078 TaxID=3133329 RepID=UPI003F62ED38
MESSEVERELEELETRIERLRALYEQYFMGIERLEPLIPRKDVERRIWVMRREQIRNTGLRFKFQMLIQRYNTFQQYWGRVSREIENGTYRRDVIRAAKRVGTKEALTIVGRKRAERYAELAEQQAAGREAARRDDGDDHEEIDVDDEAVTLAPPPLPAASATRKQPLAAPAVEDALPREAAAPVVPEASSAAPAGPQLRPALVPPATPQAAAAVKPAPLGGLPRGLGLTRPQQKPPEIKAAEAKPTEASPAGAKTSARPAADRAAPAAAGASRQRLAELAAEMRAQRAQGAKTGDAATAAAGPPAALTDAAPEPPPPPPKRPPPPLPVKPSRNPAAAPAAAAPAAAAPAAAAPAAAAPAAAAPAVTAAVTAEARGAGARRQERVHSERPPASRRRRSTAPPAADTGTASGARHATPRASSRPPDAARAGLDPAMRPRPAAPPQRPAARDDELPEQRLRQIYAKYVETKRAARESTAGVTYERLAESLRAQAAKLRATNPAKSVDYDVVVKDGKTLLKPILK